MTYDDPIAALATPFGRSALAVVRCSGEGCLQLLAPAFSRPEALLEAESHTVVYGRLLDPGEHAGAGHSADAPADASVSGGASRGEVAPSAERRGVVVDELTAMVFRAPRSYTGEDTVELVCHGSPVTIEAVLAVLRRLGFRSAEPGEFTLRAFLAGKLDLTQAEAVAELIDARTQRGRALALHRLSGSVGRRINEVKGRLVDISAAVEIHLDYPEEDSGEVEAPIEAVEAAIDDLQRLAATYATGRRLRDGAPVAIAGRTNAGKSSLFNLLLREDRSIVSEIHGTTRDYIEQGIEIDGVPISLYDTAGLRDTEEQIEGEGIRRSEAIIEGSAAVLYLVDAVESQAEDERRREIDRVRELCPGVVIPIWNKVDLTDRAAPRGFIALSSATGEGLQDLKTVLRETVLPDTGSEDGAAIIESERQKELIERALVALNAVLAGLHQSIPLDLVAVDLQDALSALGEITGEVASAEILDAMFSKFCVGK